MSDIRNAQRLLDGAVRAEITRAQHFVQCALRHVSTVRRDADFPSTVASEWADLEIRLERLADELTGWAQRETRR
jgi:hypothetical protein